MNKLKVLISILSIVFAVGVETTNYQNNQTYKITVTDKQVKNSKNSSYYLVFATSKENEDLVFKNSDLLFIGKFNSSDIQGKLKVDKNYEITTLGYRIPFLSIYPNITSVKEE